MKIISNNDLINISGGFSFDLPIISIYKKINRYFDNAFDILKKAF